MFMFAFEIVDAAMLVTAILTVPLSRKFVVVKMKSSVEIDVTKKAPALDTQIPDWTS